MHGKDHPVTAYIPRFYPGTNLCWLLSDFQNMPQNGPTFSSFADLPVSKKLALKAKKMRMDTPFTLGLCQNVTFDIVFIMIFQFWWQNPLSSISVIFE